MTLCPDEAQTIGHDHRLLLLPLLLLPLLLLLARMRMVAAATGACAATCAAASAASAAASAAAVHARTSSSGSWAGCRVVVTTCKHCTTLGWLRLRLIMTSLRSDPMGRDMCGMTFTATSCPFQRPARTQLSGADTPGFLAMKGCWHTPKDWHTCHLLTGWLTDCMNDYMPH
jgi:hypothetical protein